MYRDIILEERRKRHSRDAIIFANRYTKTNEAQKPILNLVMAFLYHRLPNHYLKL